MQVEIYSDGSSRGNPGPGGYGTVLRYVTPEGEEHIKELSGGYSLTTNNRMELLGAIVGFESLKKPCEVVFTSDSKYVTDAFNQGWIHNWKRKNWIKSDKERVKNRDLWERLLSAVEPHKVTFVWVKGHNGHKYNERCDALATAAADADNLEENMEQI